MLTKADIAELKKLNHAARKDYVLKKTMQSVYARVATESEQDKELLIARHYEKKAKLESHGIAFGAMIAVFINLVWQAFAYFIGDTAFKNASLDPQTVYGLQTMFLFTNLVLIGFTIAVLCIVAHFKRISRQEFYFEQRAMVELGICSED